MKRLRVVLLLCLAIPTVASMQSPSSPGLSFTRTDYQVSGWNASTVAVGDFNADGKPDIAVANANAPSTAVLLGNGDGSFQEYFVPYGDGQLLLAGQYLAVGDFNGDGRSDIASANFWGAVVHVGLANADGTFGPTQVDVDLPGTPLTIATGDFNHDGKLDIVVTCSIYSESLSLLLGNGDGTFQPRTDYPASYLGPQSMVVGDFNEDGNLDVVVAQHYVYDGNALNILLGNDDATFRPRSPLMPGYHFPGVVTSGDLNEDGHLDLIVSSDTSPISILLGNGDGTFQPTIDVAPSPFTTTGQILVGDVNGDGHLDLVWPNYHEDLVSVLFGNGDGTFAIANQVDFAAGGRHPMFAAMADLNGDGRMDLAVSNIDAGTVSVFGNFPSDTKPPVITVPGPSTLEAIGPAGAVAHWPAPTAADETDGTVPVTCSPESGLMFPLGVNTVTCHAADAAGNTATASFTVTVHDTTPPTITISTPVAGAVALHQTIAATYSCADAGSGVASCVGPVASGSPIDTGTVGTRTFSVNATDAVGNASSASVGYSVTYASGGGCLGSPGHAILQPVNADGTSVFKTGSTVPAKFRVCDASGNSIGTAGVVASFRLFQTVAGTVTDVDESVYSTTPDAAFRWSATDQLWIFNIGTKTLTAQTTYVYRITLLDGSMIDFRFGLK